MKNKGLIFIFDEDGNLIDKSLGVVRGKSAYQTPVVFITPNPLTMPVMATYLLKDSLNVEVTQFLIPTNDEISDWVDSDAPYYQDIQDYSVFKAPIKKTALTKISRFYQGSIGLSFTQFNVILSELATNYKGEFGVDDLPASAVEGDYYKCIKGQYVSTNASLTFNYGEYAVWHNGAWEKGSVYVGNMQTNSQDVSVDPSALGEVAEIPEEDYVAIYTAIGGLQEQIDEIDTHLDNLINITEEEVEW